MDNVFSDLRPSMNLFQQRVRIFCRLCETGSFTKAAELSGLSQSVVSRTIADLEGDLQVQLFDHAVRPIRPTAAGQSLYQILSEQINSLDDQLSSLTTDAGLRAPLRIGFVESLARAMSRTILGDVGKEYSSLTVLTGISAYLVSLLDRDQLDIFVSPNPFAYRTDLVRQYIFTEPSIVVLPKNTGLPKRPTWQQLQLCGLPMIQYHRSNTGGNLDAKLFSKLGLHFFHRIEVDINALALDYIAAGWGWMITRPTTLVQHPDLAERIDVRPMPDPVASRELYVVSRRGFNQGLAEKIALSAARCFCGKVVPAMADKMPWIKPYLMVRGSKNDERIHIFGDESEPSASDAYIL